MKKKVLGLVLAASLLAVSAPIASADAGGNPNNCLGLANSQFAQGAGSDFGQTISFVAQLQDELQALTIFFQGIIQGCS